MKFTVTVPCDKIALMVSLIKKSGCFKTMHVPVIFTSHGLYTLGWSRFFVPVSLDMGTAQFCIDFNDLIPLGSDGDVEISFHAADNIFENDNSKWEEAATLRYTKCGIPNQLEAVVRSPNVDYELLFKIPEETIESSNFLPAIVTCSPFLSNNKFTALGSFCIDRGSIVALDSCCMLSINNIDVPSFGDSVFLLSKFNASVLPKSGTCRMGSFLRDCDGEQKYCLYINLSDFCVWFDCAKGKFPKWKSLLEKKEIVPEVGTLHKLHIDKRDAEAFLKRMKALPESENGSVLLSIVDGRLCIDSASSKVVNVRLRFSEYTTGIITSPTGIACNYFRSVLPFAENVFQTFYIGEKLPGMLIFESDNKIGCVCPYGSDVTKFKPVESVVDLKDFWNTKKTIQKTTPNKQLQRGSLFVNAERELITELRLENEQLHKTIEELQNKIVELSKSNNC
jgi:hypothetical protein